MGYRQRQAEVTAAIVARVMRSRQALLAGAVLALCVMGLAGCGFGAEGAGPDPTPTASVETRVPTNEPSATLTATPTSLPIATVTATAGPTATATASMTRPAQNEGVAIPVLMYHHLQELDANAGQLLKTWTVSPSDFAAQLDYLQGRGFKTVTLAQVVAFFDGRASLPEHPIILTFDDAWIDDYKVAFPELTKRGMVGVFLVPTSYVQAGGKLLMNWDMALEMDRAGMEIGSHTIRHADLTKVPVEQAVRELVGSKQVLEDKLGHPVVSLSYPYGSFTPRVVAETEAAGYRAAVILCCGYEQRGDMLLRMPRIRVSYGDTLEELAKKLP